MFAAALATTLTLTAGGLLAASNDRVQRVVLDDRVVVAVPIATNRVTTVTFPGPISAIDGAGVGTDPKTPAQVYLAHAQNSAFFSLRAAKRAATANLNVRWNKKTYAFELIESEAPVFVLQMELPPAPISRASAPSISPHRLLGLLDKAKAFPLLRQQHAESVAGVDYRSLEPHPVVTDFSDLQIRLHEIFRFDFADTLVFHLTLTNKCQEEIRLNPDDITVQVGNRLYYQAINDAPSVVPAHADATVYVGFTGTPDGGRNELSVKNDFSILLGRQATAATTNNPAQALNPIAP